MVWLVNEVKTVKDRVPSHISLELIAGSEKV